jgi:hypothetical protein
VIAHQGIEGGLADALDGLAAFHLNAPEKRIGPRQDIIARAQAIAEEIGGYVYGESENGGTNTIYVSPVPFEEINRAATAGDGRPHLEPLQDAMADANRLAAAMVIAPVAGQAAAAVRFLKVGSAGKPVPRSEEA